jgi:AMP nucleosidase
MKRQDDGQYIARRNFSNMDYRPIWGIRSTMNPALSMLTPQRIATEAFTDAAAAVVRLGEIYERNTRFLRDCFEAYVNGESLTTRVRATYPFVRLTTSSHARLDSRLSYGFASGPGVHETTVTRPDLFRAYLTEQIKLLIENHNVPVEIRPLIDRCATCSTRLISPP